MKYIIFTLLFFGQTLMAQEACPCCTSDHQSFDFWIGDWVVFDTLGTKIGENTITKLEDNCIISESWTGVSGTTGKSYNYFDSQNGNWNQLWLDNSGGNLSLKGNGDGKKMILTSALTKGNTSSYFNRISWTLNEDKTVTQLWERLDAEKMESAVVFKGAYRKKEE